MNVKLTPHAAQLLKSMHARGDEPIEVFLEDALEVLAREQGANPAQAGGATSILELQGLGKEIWRGMDAQEHVNHERAAWNG
jgi:hypothetical protein